MQRSYDSHDQLAGKKRVCRDESDLFISWLSLLGAMRLTHPATLIQPVIQDKIGTHFGHDTEPLDAAKIHGLSSITYRLSGQLSHI